jgi:hypothetical protein
MLLSAEQLALASKSFSVKPAQPWVRTITSSTGDVSSSDSSSTVLLEDIQVKVGRTTVDRYYHYTTKVDNTSGLDDLSQLRFYYEPSYQQLAIHFVRIQRSGQALQALRPNEIRVIQQEDELDQQLYNGTQAALIFVNDLRVGDIVDYAYTITGDNPVLGGRFADTFYFGDDGSIEEFSLRLLCPTSRALAIKTDNTDLQPTKQLIGDETEYVWSQKHVSDVDTDGSTPSWFSPYPRITVSEFQKWSDVVDWAMPYYGISPITDAALRSKVDKWKNTLQSPEERALAALRFVQDEIRYLGIELGRYSHQPTEPQKVFARRFGDCKDKSLLLATLYSALGIEAVPALVNTRARTSVDSWQPSPFAFDHVIVKATINGNTYWLDPTISYQRGGLSHYYPPPYQRALPLRTGSRGLEPIPAPTTGSGSIEAVEAYSRENGQAAITLSVTTTYRGSEADQMRYVLSISSLPALAKTFLNFYAESTPTITADGVPVVQDDESSNTLIIKEKYSIAEMWKDDKHRFLAEKIWMELQKPRVSQRTMPLAVSYPLSIRETILVDLGPGYSLPLTTEVFADDALRFDYRYTKNENQLRVDYSLQTFRDAVPVEKIQQHLAVLDRAHEYVGFELPRSSMAYFSVSNDRGSSVFKIVATLVGVLLFGGVLFWVLRGGLQRSSPRRVVQTKKAKVGASPETAFRVGSDEELERALSNYACRCGNRPYKGGTPPEREGLTYDGKRLVAIHLLCDTCKHSNDLYISSASAEDSGGIATTGNELVNN